LLAAGLEGNDFQYTLGVHSLLDAVEEKTIYQESNLESPAFLSVV
jgi:hypothetical protein